MKGKIAEVFASVQGEGIYLGEKQIFVRFYGCNLNCDFCDTKLSSFIEYELQELFTEIKMYSNNCHSISFTGGEPLLQKDFLKEILKLTHNAGFKNYLETNGTLPEALEEVIQDLHIIAMDLKFPSSTGSEALWDVHRRFLEIASGKEVFLKAVICGSTKEDDLREAAKLIKDVNKSIILILQPNSYESSEHLTEKLKKFKEICWEEKITACIIPQMHKIMAVE